MFTSNVGCDEERNDMLIVWGVLSILLPIYAGWRVWKYLNRNTQPDLSDSVGLLLKQVGYSAGTTFVLMLICFLILAQFGSVQPT